MINLRLIVKSLKLNTMELGKALFPENDHPQHAYDRLARGVGQLNAKQIDKLCEITGMTFEELKNFNGWKMTTIEGVNVFENADYKAFLDLKTWVVKVYDKQKFVKQIILSNPSIKLSDFIDMLNLIVKKP